MDSISLVSETNYEEKSEEGRLLVPNKIPQITVAPIQNESNGFLSSSEPLRTRRSFCGNQDLTVARRPSAIVSAFRQNRRASNSGSIIFE